MSGLYFIYYVFGIQCTPQDLENLRWEEDYAGKSVVRATEQQPEGFGQYGFHIWPEHQASTGNTGLTSQGCLRPYAQMETVGSKRDHFPLARPVHHGPCALLTYPSAISTSFALVGKQSALGFPVIRSLTFVSPDDTG